MRTATCGGAWQNREHAETVKSELGSGYELLRRCRNAAGHPDVPGNVDGDTVFLNLRAFIEYARRITNLAQYLRKNGAVSPSVTQS